MSNIHNLKLWTLLANYVQFFLDVSYQLVSLQVIATHRRRLILSELTQNSKEKAWKIVLDALQEGQFIGEGTQIPREDVTEKMSLVDDFKADSLDMQEFVMSVEDQLGFNLPEEELNAAKVVKDEDGNETEVPHQNLGEFAEYLAGKIEAKKGSGSEVA